VAEDAFIIFREAANFANGHGMTWNVGERVQAFTDPLWFFLVTPIFLLKLDPYFSVLGLSFVLSVGALILLLRTASLPHLGSFAVLALLLCSRGFIDYSSSGLENPLNHFLLAIYLVFFVFGRESRDRLHWHVLFVVLLWLTRPDAFLPIFPLLVWRFIRTWRARELSDWKWIAALMPAVLWLTFSIFYFGSPVPNTALAKVATSISAAKKFSMALEYFVWHIRNDLASMLLIALGIVLGACSRDTRMRLLAAGLALWLVYLFAIGADYMQGRFLSAVVVIAAFIVIIAMKRLPKLAALPLFLMALASSSALAYTVNASSLYHNPHFSLTGISDERGFYYPWLGLQPVLELHGNWQSFSWLRAGERAARAPGDYASCAIGMFAYSAGPESTVIDPDALADAFLARLPSKTNVRPGHYERDVPYEYFESRASGHNQIADPYWRTVYDDVNLVTRGNLFDPQRLRAIVRLNVADLRGRPLFTELTPAEGAMPPMLCPKFENGEHVKGTLMWHFIQQSGRIAFEPIE